MATTMSPATAAWRALGCDVRLVVTAPQALGPARAMLEADLGALDRAASRFRPDSEVSRLADAGGRPMPVSPVLADAVAVALAGAGISDGDLDPTMGADLAALGYDRTFSELAPPPPAPPEPGATRAAAVPGLHVHATPTWRDVHLDAPAGTLTVPAGVVLDLGATAKARCADLSAERIAGRLGCGVLVSLGGDIAVAGPVPQGGWIVRVQEATGDPGAAPIGLWTTVALTSGGLATSSTAARRWRRGGSVLHHILDPRTHEPAISSWTTVSVAAGSATLANIASTTSIIRGRRAPAWLSGMPVAARLVAPPTTPGGAAEVVLVGPWPVDGQER